MLDLNFACFDGPCGGGRIDGDSPHDDSSGSPSHVSATPTKGDDLDSYHDDSGGPSHVSASDLDFASDDPSHVSASPVNSPMPFSSGDERGFESDPEDNVEDDLNEQAAILLQKTLDPKLFLQDSLNMDIEDDHDANEGSMGQFSPSQRSGIPSIQLKQLVRGPSSVDDVFAHKENDDDDANQHFDHDDANQHHNDDPFAADPIERIAAEFQAMWQHLPLNVQMAEITGAWNTLLRERIKTQETYDRIHVLEQMRLEIGNQMSIEFILHRLKLSLEQCCGSQIFFDHLHLENDALVNLWQTSRTTGRQRLSSLEEDHPFSYHVAETIRERGQLVSTQAMDRIVRMMQDKLRLETPQQRKILLFDRDFAEQVVARASADNMNSFPRCKMLDAFDLFLFPVHAEGHFFLLVADGKNDFLFIYDSISHFLATTRIANLLASCMAQFLGRPQPLCVSYPNLSRPMQIRADCAIFTISALRSFLVDVPYCQGSRWDPNNLLQDAQESAYSMRRHIHAEYVTGRLNFALPETTNNVCMNMNCAAQQATSKRSQSRRVKFHPMSPDRCVLPVKNSVSGILCNLCQRKQVRVEQAMREEANEARTTRGNKRETNQEESNGLGSDETKRPKKQDDKAGKGKEREEERERKKRKKQKQKTKTKNKNF